MSRLLPLSVLLSPVSEGASGRGGGGWFSPISFVTSVRVERVPPWVVTPLVFGRKLIYSFPPRAVCAETNPETSNLWVLPLDGVDVGGSSL